jgi:cysteine desulfurase
VTAWHYLDHAATSPVRPEVVAPMVAALTEGFGNPSGGHALARAARGALDEARTALAALVGADPGEVVFTSGGTEADNLALRGVLAARGGVPVCTAAEHHAVLSVVEAAGGRVVPVDRRGLVDLDALGRALDDDVSIVSTVLVNNEVGAVQPLDAVADVVRARAPQAVLHTDAAQALTWLDVAIATEPADLVTLAAHKCGGPKGTGALVVRGGTPLVAQQVGGGQERDRRSGTQDVAGAIGFAHAARAAAAGRAELAERTGRWRAQLVEAVRAAVPGAVDTAAPTGDVGHLAPGIVHLCFPQVDSEALLFLLEHDHRVLASAGSSCASGAQGASHVVAALGVDPALAAGALRLSMGWSTTEADVAAATAGAIEVAGRLAAHARDGAPA